MQVNIVNDPLHDGEDLAAACDLVRACDMEQQLFLDSVNTILDSDLYKVPAMIPAQFLTLADCPLSENCSLVRFFLGK